jgi:transcriptional regulator with XRE-family HTH domain
VASAADLTAVLGGLMRSHRLARQMRQADVAAGVGVQQAVVSRWELGQLEPSIWEMLLVEDALGLSRGYLLTEAGVITPSVESLSAAPGLNRRQRQFIRWAIEAAQTSLAGEGSSGSVPAARSRSSSKHAGA